MNEDTWFSVFVSLLLWVFIGIFARIVNIHYNLRQLDVYSNLMLVMALMGFILLGIFTQDTFKETNHEIQKEIIMRRMER